MVRGQFCPLYALIYVILFCTGMVRWKEVCDLDQNVSPLWTSDGRWDGDGELDAFYKSSSSRFSDWGISG